MASQAGVGPGSIPFRDLGDLVSHTFLVYRRNFWPFVFIALPTVLVSLVGSFVIPEFASETTVTSEFDFENFADIFRALLVTVPLSIVITLVAIGAVAHAVAVQYLGQEIDVWASYRKALGKAWILIIAAFLGFLGIAAAVMLSFIIIGIPLLALLVVSWAFYTQAVMIDGEGPTSALGRSYALVKGSRCRVLGIGIIFTLISLGLSIPVYILSGITGIINPTVASVISIAGTVLVMPVFYIGLTALYFDLRVRNEGLTLDTLASQMGWTRA